MSSQCPFLQDPAACLVLPLTFSQEDFRCHTPFVDVTVDLNLCFTPGSVFIDMMGSPLSPCLHRGGDLGSREAALKGPAYLHSLLLPPVLSTEPSPLPSFVHHVLFLCNEMLPGSTTVLKPAKILKKNCSFCPLTPGILSHCTFLPGNSCVPC
jgi:hypothetical protein